MEHRQSIRINSTDYDGDVVIELFDFAQGSEAHWHVPAWEERGMGSLAGPFASEHDALRAAFSWGIRPACRRGA
jgi:hypothetical protein